MTSCNLTLELFGNCVVSHQTVQNKNICLLLCHRFRFGDSITLKRMRKRERERERERREGEPKVIM